MKFIKHYVKSMHGSLVRECIFCGEVIFDERNIAMTKEETQKNKLPEGEIFVSSTTPAFYLLQISKTDQFTECSFVPEPSVGERLAANFYKRIRRNIIKRNKNS